MTEGERSDGLPDPGQERRTHDFDASYVAGRPPWDIGRPQSAFRELADRGRLVGRVLDVGCGTGEHALMAAALGHDATGVDVASTAVDIARRKAGERGLDARFLTWNALELADLGESFDTVLDCGLFHVFEDRERSTFVAALRASMPVGAWYSCSASATSNRATGALVASGRRRSGSASATGGVWRRSPRQSSRRRSRRGAPGPGSPRSSGRDRVRFGLGLQRRHPRRSWSQPGAHRGQESLVERTTSRAVTARTRDSVGA